jgi:putative transposase
MYDWRKMTTEERTRALDERKARHIPWHSPPHLDFSGEHRYIITAACYEHAPVIGKSTERMIGCEEDLLKVFQELGAEVYAWCVLPNHYHVLARTDRIEVLRKEMGKFHGRSSFIWNGEDGLRGRKVWHNCFERPMKSERHFRASLNYIHHNPVHHGYVHRWQDWPYSSAAEFLHQHGRAQALKFWRDYPVLDYGKDWDVY